MLSQVKGYMTVYLSLSISIILSLILTLYSGARIGAIRMKTECVMDIAMNSVLAEYNRALFERYGLIMTDISYGGTSPSVVNAEEHLKHYVQKNFELTDIGKLERSTTLLGLECEDASITGVSFASDNNGAVLRRQILEYMKAEPIEGMIANLTDSLSIVKSSGMDSRDVLQEARANSEAIESYELPKIINEEGEEEEQYFSDPVKNVWSITGSGILSLVLPPGVGISDKYTRTDLLISNRDINKGTGLDDSENLSVTELGLIDQYIYEKCGSYGNEREGSELDYQLEYILEGNSSDRRNLEEIASKLFAWRAASNAMYVFSDSGKVSMADATATLLTAIFFMPELKELVKNSILFAWAIIETVSDLKVLYKGGRVPLLKDSASWKTGFDNIFAMDFGNSYSEGSGLSYGEYLRIMLLMQNLNTKTYRLMDIMEMDIRKTDGNSSFMLDYCMDIFCAEVKAKSRFGYKVKIERIYGYEQYP
ncbi:MAG: DUF5702 domain-containing protein [Butyrivibrio sp.]|nr:DUF5702 domain-containing protein [Butyrivibrio sp.]